MDRMRVRGRRSAWLALIGVMSMEACESTTAVAVVQDVATSLAITVNGGGMVPENEIVLELGESVELSAVATNPLGLAVPAAIVTWSSTNTSVAEVDDAGVVTAVGAGNTEIRAASGDVVSSLSVVVNDDDSVGGP